MPVNDTRIYDGNEWVSFKGANGSSGTNGYSVLSGAGAPTSQGVNGDFYIDTTAFIIYGPKTAGVWGVGVSLIGPAGSPGSPGSPGADGSPDTAAQVLAKLITVDGAGSGLDADLLDGNHAAAFVLTTDSRLSDARTPTAHDHSSNKLAQANTHESADTDSVTSALHHTLGTGANQACAGNDARLSDARTPTAHTHTGVYQPVDADLTAIAALTDTGGYAKRTAADTWAIATPSAADVGAVPTSRTVNSKALSSDISLTASDVGAQPVDADLTAIAALSGTGGYAKRTAADTWSIATPTAADVNAVPYTGATGAVTLGANTLSTTAGIKTPKIYPNADSSTAVQINKANGTTTMLNFDTSNDVSTFFGRVDIKNADGSTGTELRPGGNGLNNFFIGISSGQANTTGSYNYSLGTYTLPNNTTGSYNIAVGRESLVNNTTGTGNIAIGKNALSGNTTGDSNFAVGASALTANTTGSQNFAIGESVLSKSITASSNFGIGLYSLYNCTTGNNNFAIGPYCLYGTTTGFENIAIGNTAVPNNTTGVYNIGIGSSTLGALTDGSWNIAIGKNACPNLGSGSNNIVIGGIANTTSSTISDSLVIGGLLYGTGLGLNSVATSGKLGIATTLNASGVTYSTLNIKGNQLFVGDSSTQEQPRASIKTTVIDNTNATRKYGLNLSAWDTSERSAIDVEATGSDATIKLHGDTWFDVSGAGFPYGSFFGLEVNQLISNAAQNTWYLVSQSAIDDGELNLVSHDGSGKLTVSLAGKYLINWSITFESSQANKHIRGAIAKNGTALNPGQSHIESSANQELVIAGNAIISIAAGQTIELAVCTNDAGTPNINIDDVSLSLTMVGG